MWSWSPEFVFELVVVRKRKVTALLYVGCCAQQDCGSKWSLRCAALPTGSGSSLPMTTPGMPSSSGRTAGGYNSGASSPPQKQTYTPNVSPPMGDPQPQIDGKQFFQVAR